MDNTLEQLKKSWRIMEESEKKDPAFCYMVYISPEDEKPFIDIQKELKLKGELIESGEFHVTIRYVRTDKDYDEFINFLTNIKLPTLTAECVGFEIYGKDKDTLVVELESEDLHKWFEKVNDWLTKHDFPKSDFPTYKPHISLTEKVGIEKPEWKDEYRRKVKFNIHIVSNTDYARVFKRIK